MEYIARLSQQLTDLLIYHKMADNDERDWIELNEPWRLKQEPEPVITDTKWYEDLEQINGIGKETAKDLGLTFKNEEEFINALIEDRVPIRNDKVKLLREYFNIQMKGGNN